MVRRMQQEARIDPDGFWAKEAERLPWFKKWDSVFEWTPPTFKWFSGAETNLAYNCLDHHVANGRMGHAALIGGTPQQLEKAAERTAIARVVPEAQRVGGKTMGQ